MSNDNETVRYALLRTDTSRDWPASELYEIDELDPMSLDEAVAWAEQMAVDADNPLWPDNEVWLITIIGANIERSPEVQARREARRAELAAKTRAANEAAERATYERLKAKYEGGA